MATCAVCGTTILFGGQEVEGRRACNANCAAALRADVARQQIPEGAAQDRAQQIRTGACPKCGGVGQPIDVQLAHRCLSYLIATRRSSHRVVACHPCGNKLRIRESLMSLVAGWWGFPWGFLFTPLQIGRNLSAMLATPSTGPSPELVEVARQTLLQEQGLLPRA